MGGNQGDWGGVLYPRATGPPPAVRLRTFPAALAPALDGVRTNRDLIRFVNLPGATVTHAALWSGASLLWVVELAAPITLAPGDAIDFYPGDLAFGLEAAA